MNPYIEHFDTENNVNDKTSQSALTDRQVTGRLSINTERPCYISYFDPIVENFY